MTQFVSWDLRRIRAGRGSDRLMRQARISMRCFPPRFGFEAADPPRSVTAERSQTPEVYLMEYSCNSTNFIFFDDMDEAIAEFLFVSAHVK